jgi:hypothetical protein
MFVVVMIDIALRNAYYQGLVCAKREQVGAKIEIIPRHMSAEEVVLYNLGLRDGRSQNGGPPGASHSGR